MSGIAAERAEAAAGRVEEDGVEVPRERRAAARRRASDVHVRRAPARGRARRRVAQPRRRDLGGDDQARRPARSASSVDLPPGRRAGVEDAARPRAARWATAAIPGPAGRRRPRRRGAASAAPAALARRPGTVQRLEASSPRPPAAARRVGDARVQPDDGRRRAPGRRARARRPPPAPSRSSQRSASQRGSEPAGGQPAERVGLVGSGAGGAPSRASRRSTAFTNPAARGAAARARSTDSETAARSGTRRCRIW